MSDKPDYKDFCPYYIVGTYKGFPACNVLPMDSDKELSPMIVSGMLTALLDSIIESLPENMQNYFEQTTLEVFSDMVKERYEHVTKYKLEE
jgi:hypothetical protein